ncbi:MAG: response regulator transcription factor [Anaerolinea sp.]|nr:response regulator transcription factor [Anaerolinea sp.]
MTATILVVDDDRSIVRLVASYLEQAQFKVQTAFDGSTALHILHNEPIDLLVLDLMLPDQNGWEITRQLRANRRLNNLPIIMLTARATDTDKILGLELGADDYITKPFNPHEVVARVRSVLRRVASPPQSVLIRVGALEMDVERRAVTIEGTAIDLTPTEFSILKVLMQNPNYVFSRSELITRSLGYEYESIERTLDSHIRNLRKKIEPDTSNPRYIQTVYGVGYRLEGD